MSSLVVEAIYFKSLKGNLCWLGSMNGGCHEVQAVSQLSCPILSKSVNEFPGYLF